MATVPIDAPSSTSLPGDDFFFRPFDARHAACIPRWIGSTRELTWLAPATVPPLTAEKVLSWEKERRQRFFLWREAQSEPNGYAELNEMPDRGDQMWIGHFILDPTARGNALGVRFAQGLVARAFAVHDAKEVLLVVFPDNHRAIRCYERAGFQQMGTERKFFPETNAEHGFLRMGINRSRFTKLVQAGQILARPPDVRAL